MHDPTLNYHTARPHHRLTRLALTSFIFGCLTPIAWGLTMAFLLFSIGIPRLNEGGPLPWHLNLCMSILTLAMFVAPLVAATTGSLALIRTGRSHACTSDRWLAFIGLA